MNNKEDFGALRCCFLSFSLVEVGIKVYIRPKELKVGWENREGKDK
jgi:hypothetical protein